MSSFCRWDAIAGAGALASPLVATQFAQLRHWSFHYLVSLGIALSNTAILAIVFRFKTQDGKQRHLPWRAVALDRLT